jgi:hypothetical protein
VARLFNPSEMPYPDGDDRDSHVISMRRLWLARYFLSAIAHPGVDDESVWQRRGFVMAYVAEDFQGLRTRISTTPTPPGVTPAMRAQLDRDFFANYIRDHIEPLGDRETLWRSMTKAQHLDAYTEGCKAISLIGRTTILLRTLAQHHAHELRRGASLSKALDIVSADAKISRRSAWPLWGRYKSVAHIMAAFVYLGQTYNYQGPAGDEAALHHLYAAADFQDFLLGFSAQQVDRPLLTESEMVLVPPHGATEPLLTFHPLAKEILATVQARFA